MEPATTIIKKFGGADKVASIVGVHRTRVYKWCHSKEKGGTDGMIPHWHVSKLIAAASELDVEVSPGDFFQIEQKGAA